MQVYSIEFFDVKSETIMEMVYYKVCHNDYYGKYINLGRKPILIIKECDLNIVADYGGGIKSLNYIGNLLENNEEESKDELTINVSCNLIGKEDVERVVEELQDKLNKLRVNISV